MILYGMLVEKDRILRNKVHYLLQAPEKTSWKDVISVAMEISNNTTTDFNPFSFIDVKNKNNI